MQGSPRVIEALNDLLTLELTVVNQYFVHSRMCVNWGYGRIAGQQRAIAMDEMRDAEQIIDRILFLDGVPNMQRLGSVTVGETVSEQFQIALEGSIGRWSCCIRGSGSPWKKGTRPAASSSRAGCSKRKPTWTTPRPNWA